MSNEQLIKKINDGEHERHQSCSLLHSRKRQTLDLRIFHQRGDSSRQAQSFLIAPRGFPRDRRQIQLSKFNLPSSRLRNLQGSFHVPCGAINEHSISHPVPRVKGVCIKIFRDVLFPRASQSSKILDFLCKSSITFGSWDAHWFAWGFSYTILHPNWQTQAGKNPRARVRSLIDSMLPPICLPCKS
jgi:hypothetical protein